MTSIKTNLSTRGFMGGMEKAPEGWDQTRIESCEPRQRADLAHCSELDDGIYYHVRIQGDNEDMELEVQCRAYPTRERKRYMNIAGMLTRNGQTVPYWATVDLQSRSGYLKMSAENFGKIGFKPQPLSAF